MKPIIYLVALLPLLGTTPAAWAGAAEEVVAIGQQRTAVYEQGDAETYARPTLTTQRSPRHCNRSGSMAKRRSRITSPPFSRPIRLVTSSDDRAQIALMRTTPSL
jgi:hypothetical protein